MEGNLEMPAECSQRAVKKTGRSLLIISLAAGITLLTLVTARAAIADYEMAVRAVSRGDYAAAYREFQTLANRGDPRGQNGLGILYVRGWGVKRDLDKALNLFHIAAKQGHRAAENNLGELYMAGLGVPKDFHQAFQWCWRAAQKGDPDAQNNLGVMFAGGLGVEQDHAMAMYWFQKSAKQGNVQAQANVGHLYRTGDGVERDYVLAYAWYGIAAAGGFDMGVQLRDSVATFLTEDQLEQGRAIARDLYFKYSKAHQRMAGDHIGH
jgi:TPR repeat protein